MYWKTYYYYIKTINRTEEVNQKKETLYQPVFNVAALAGPFNTGWYYEQVLKGGFSHGCPNRD